MSSTKGREYEHHLADIVASSTNGELIPLGTGYNSQYSEAVDMIIDDGRAVHAFELKRTGQDAYTMYWSEDDYQKDDLYQLCKFCQNYPRPTYPYSGVRFDNRQLTLTKLYINDWPDQDETLDTAVQTTKTSVNHTPSGNLRYHKPDTDWPGRNLDDHDGQHVLDRIGYVF